MFYPGLEQEQSEYWRIPLDQAENLVMADVYFSEIIYTEILQMSAFTLKELLRFCQIFSIVLSKFSHLISRDCLLNCSSVGGALGLWVGASIITVVDAIYYLIMKAGQGSRRKKQKPTDQEAEKL